MTTPLLSVIELQTMRTSLSGLPSEVPCSMQEVMVEGQDHVVEEDGLERTGVPQAGVRPDVGVDLRPAPVDVLLAVLRDGKHGS
jgi:hypothetical protein